MQRIVTGFAYAVTGFNAQLSEQRLKVCRNCAEMRGGLSCNLCGCILEAKTRVPEEYCPAGKCKAHRYEDTIDTTFEEEAPKQLNA
jgi:hypothetical protein